VPTDTPPVLFKGGAPPDPCPAAADLDRSGVITAGDLVYLINHVFISGPIPSDVCTIIPDVWSCP